MYSNLLARLSKHLSHLSLDFYTARPELDSRCTYRRIGRLELSRSLSFSMVVRGESESERIEGAHTATLRTWCARRLASPFSGRVILEECLGWRCALFSPTCIWLQSKRWTRSTAGWVAAMHAPPRWNRSSPTTRTTMRRYAAVTFVPPDHSPPIIEFARERWLCRAAHLHARNEWEEREKDLGDRT